jgi:hypothetical protein
LYGAFFVKEFARAAHLFPGIFSQFMVLSPFPSPSNAPHRTASYLAGDPSWKTGGTFGLQFAQSVERVLTALDAERECVRTKKSNLVI